MKNQFDQALSDVFEGREQNFSEHLMGLLRQLYERGGADATVPAAQALPHAAVGDRVASVGNLRVGDFFQNSFLQRRGQKRRVMAVQQKGSGVVLVTDLLDSNGSVRSPSEVFDDNRLNTYAPYKRVR